VWYGLEGPCGQAESQVKEQARGAKGSMLLVSAVLLLLCCAALIQYSFGQVSDGLDEFTSPSKNRSGILCRSAERKVRRISWK
jgi:hypothetical protein